MENKDYKLIPFDIQRAKTPSNPEGLEVVMKSGKDARIICTDRSSRGYPIVALIRHETGFEETHYCDEYGVFSDKSECLLLKEPIMKRRMTNQELSWWLRDAPEEHREFIYFLEGDNDKEHRVVHSVFDYIPGRSNEPVDSILIRSNGGEWREPLEVELRADDKHDIIESIKDSARKEVLRLAQKWINNVLTQGGMRMPD